MARNARNARTSKDKTFRRVIATCNAEVLFDSDNRSVEASNVDNVDRSEVGVDQGDVAGPIFTVDKAEREEDSEDDVAAGGGAGVEGGAGGEGGMDGSAGESEIDVIVGPEGVICVLSKAGYILWKNPAWEEASDSERDSESESTEATAQEESWESEGAETE